MAPPKDAIGNNLAKDDFCMVLVDGQWMLAQIANIDEGGILIGQGNRATPGMLGFVIEVNTPFTPGGGKKMKGVFKLHQPEDPSSANIPDEEPKPN